MKYCYLFLLLFCGSCLFGQVVQSDSLALVGFYNGLDGPNWTKQANWLTDEPVGSWEGITVEDNRITNITIVSGGLDGDLPDAFYELTGLKRFNLLNNNITGPLKDDIVNLTVCTGLGFQGCKLSGTFPNAVGQMTQLSSLAFSSCQFEGPLPDSIGNLQNLSIVYFQGNKFEGPIPQSWKGMKTLSTINIEGNMLTGNLDVCGTWPRLRNLGAGGNNWDPQPFPMWLDTLPEILGFNCYNCNLVGEIPDIDLTDQEDMSTLYLPDNHLSGDIRRLLGPDDSFFAYYLDLTNNNFSGALDLRNLGNVQRISVAENNYDEIIGVSFLDLNSLFLRENAFDFEDLHVITDLINSDTVSVQINPMDSLLMPDTIVIDEGAELVIQSGSMASGDHYVWYNGNQVLSGATETELKITNISPEQAGIYHCAMSNDSIEDFFRLYRHPVTVIVNATTGEKDISQSPDLNIYPTVARDFITVEFSPNLPVNSYAIYSNTGQLIESGVLNGRQTKKQIEIGDLQTGAYILRIYGPTNNYTARFMKI